MKDIIMTSSKLQPVDISAATEWNKTQDHEAPVPNYTPTQDESHVDGSDIPPELGDRITAMFKHFDVDETLAVLIDGPNQYYTQRGLDLQIDYLSFAELFRRCGKLKYLYYFSAVSEDEHHNQLKRNLTWLKNNGYRVVSKPSKKLASTTLGGPLFKGNMDVEITIYALVHCSDVDHIVLASGDGDFTILVEELQKAGKKVTVVSSERCPTARIATELRDQADGFIDLDLIRTLIARSFVS